MRNIEAWHYHENWGRELPKSTFKRCSHCGDATSTRRALKRDRLFYCSPECSIAKDAELAILEEAISKRIMLRDVKPKTA